eukprot:g60065.t1
MVPLVLGVVLGTHNSSKRLPKKHFDFCCESERPVRLSAKPDPARVAAFLVGTKSSGLKTALRNEFDKIDRARITLVQVTDQLVKLREKNIVGKGEPGQGWIVNDPETGKTIRCNSKQDRKDDQGWQRMQGLSHRDRGQVKAEKEEKEQEKLAQKALKREQELEMIRPQGEKQSQDVCGGPEAGGRSCELRKDREDKSLMISVNESDRLVARSATTSE